jgi:hypothetical protein
VRAGQGLPRRSLRLSVASLVLVAILRVDLVSLTVALTRSDRLPGARALLGRRKVHRPLLLGTPNIFRIRLRAIGRKDNHNNVRKCCRNSVRWPAVVSDGECLAAKAKVSVETIVRFENGERLRDQTLGKMRTALEKAGVEFIAKNGGGPGVRLAKRRGKKR